MTDSLLLRLPDLPVSLRYLELTGFEMFLVPSFSLAGGRGPAGVVSARRARRGWEYRLTEPRLLGIPDLPVSLRYLALTGFEVFLVPSFSFAGGGGAGRCGAAKF